MRASFCAAVLLVAPQPWLQAPASNPLVCVHPAMQGGKGEGLRSLSAASCGELRSIPYMLCMLCGYLCCVAAGVPRPWLRQRQSWKRRQQVGLSLSGLPGPGLLASLCCPNVHMLPKAPVLPKLRLLAALHCRTVD